jgi:hypothetical protein
LFVADLVTEEKHAQRWADILTGHTETNVMDLTVVLMN